MVSNSRGLKNSWLASRKFLQEKRTARLVEKEAIPRTYYQMQGHQSGSEDALLWSLLRGSWQRASSPVEGRKARPPLPQSRSALKGCLSCGVPWEIDGSVRRSPLAVPLLPQPNHTPFTPLNQRCSWERTATKPLQAKVTHSRSTFLMEPHP